MATVRGRGTGNGARDSDRGRCSGRGRVQDDLITTEPTQPILPALPHRHIVTTRNLI